MALPSSYLTSFKNLDAILDSVRAAQAPDRFTIKFLEQIGYTSAADRLVIKMLKTLGLLRESGEPTQAYHEFLDPSLSGAVLANGLRDAYADLFQINKNAHEMTAADVRAKFKTISQGAYSDAVLGKMANTFLAFAKNADFESVPPTAIPLEEPGEADDIPLTPRIESGRDATTSTKARLVYEINLHLPATRDPAVYDALFASLAKHLDI
ncbi:DUF5343 domain-containing protein [Nocardioides sp. AX2bis]|uniref:DUF5343 domain-containing protein n=1 Tax=Nocardioides sp. AX2bis TaxID=2653157 RepID=UPI0012F09A4C|nr:DUF5343 domain-containing protein [Nocardioides sp. AX2bis]VXC10872.1 conserved hypothetical protein [Nocardioides sp. AX2bis]